MGITDHIYQVLKKRLENGNYPAGTRFPSESTLADEFSVNKMTMNKIVSMLAEQGYLIRGNRGAGTRVGGKQNTIQGRSCFSRTAQALLHTDSQRNDGGNHAQ